VAVTSRRFGAPFGVLTRSIYCSSTVTSGSDCCSCAVSSAAPSTSPGSSFGVSLGVSTGNCSSTAWSAAPRRSPKINSNFAFRNDVVGVGRYKAGRFRLWEKEASPLHAGTVASLLPHLPFPTTCNKFFLIWRPCQPRLLAGREHGRTSPLAKLGHPRLRGSIVHDASRSSVRRNPFRRRSHHRSHPLRTQYRRYRMRRLGLQHHWLSGRPAVRHVNVW
jgi:hypothetical protein